MTGHLYVSLVKSLLRIAGFAMLIQLEVVIAGSFLVAAEVLGVVEEFV